MPNLFYVLTETTTATATEGTTASGIGAFFSSTWGSIIIIVAFIAIFYFLIIRPENKRKKQAQDMRSSISAGDEIITIGGMVGKVVDVSGDYITFETSEDRVRIKILKSAVSSKIDKNAPATADK